MKLKKINKEIFTKVKSQCKEPSKVGAVPTVGQGPVEARKGNILTCAVQRSASWGADAGGQGRGVHLVGHFSRALISPLCPFIFSVMIVS